MDTNFPHILHQKVELELNLDEDEVIGRTVLWLGYKEPVQGESELYLHCRQCKVSEVQINGSTCQFVHNDALACLDPYADLDDSSCQYSGAALDAQYRAALEISRRGELEIIVPKSVSPLAGNEYIPDPLPSRCRADVVARYEKLLNTFKLLARPRDPEPQSEPTAKADAIAADDEAMVQETEVLADSVSRSSAGRLLKVEIKYSLSTSDDDFTHSSGIVFRQGFSSSILAGNGEMPNQISSLAACVYSSHGSQGSVGDIDGVRCWLPCIDSANQRAIFDISISAPVDYSVMCTGSKIKSRTFRMYPRNAEASIITSVDMIQNRFYSVTRIPASTIGFFVGKAEKYKIPLYKSNGNVWVAMGLTETAKIIGDQHQQVTRAAVVAKSSTYARLDENDKYKANDRLEIRFKKKLRTGSPAKRQKVCPAVKSVQSHIPSEVVGLEDEEAKDGNTDEAVDLGDPLDDNANDALGSLNDHAAPARVPIHYETVKHTTLGLDIGFRQLHQYTGHRYDHENYTQIFVHELGDDFIAFDGFSLIDARFLHSDRCVYQETASHVLQITAYLYSWIKSSVPIDSNDCEFIIHGIVGYLVNHYAEQLFGEESGKYRYQKHVDTVIGIEKMGRAVPLVSYFPEKFEYFSLTFAQYLRSKSTVLMHIIEDRIGGKESMRSVLQNLIRSPLLYAPFRTSVVSSSSTNGGNSEPFPHSSNGATVRPGSISQDCGVAITRNFSAISNSSPALYSSGLDQYCDYQYSPKPSPRFDGSGMMSPNYRLSGFDQTSPSGSHGYVGSSSPYSQLYGQQSPYPLNQQSPYHQTYGHQSPYRQTFAQQSPYHQTYGQQSPYHQIYDQQSPQPQIHGQQSPHPQIYGQQSPYHQSYGQQSPPHQSYGQQSPPHQTIGSQSPFHQTYGLQSTYPQSFGQQSPSHQVYGQQSPYRSNFPASYGQQSSAYLLSTNKASSSSNPQSSEAPQEAVQSSASSVSELLPPEKIAAAPDAASAWPAGDISPSIGSAMLEIEAGLLTCEALALDTFIATIRTASKTTSTLDESFMENFVFNDGCMFIRFGVFVEPKLENRPQLMTIVCDQIGMRSGELNNAKYAFRESVKARIAEVRDDVISEVPMKIGPGIEHLSKQMHSRPGRKSGRRKEEGVTNSSNAQQSEIQKIFADKDALRDAIQVVRDMEHPLRYALLEPSSVMLGEVHTLSGDIQLIEQLYADIDPWDVIRQVQAIRSISRADPLSYPLSGKESRAVAATTGANGSNTSGGSGAVGRKSDKSPKLQLKALYDCLIGKELNEANTKAILTTGHSLYVRMEAAFALANWQNERAPQLAPSEESTKHSSDAAVGTNPKLVETRDDWIACTLLQKALSDLYVDPQSGLPAPCDFTKEGSMQMRSTLLLALASIRALNGVTPSPVIKSLLLFAENEINEPLEVEISDASSVIATGGNRQASVASSELSGSEEHARETEISLVTFDDSHVKTVMLLALSRIRTESFSKSNEQDVLRRICTVANRYLVAEEASAFATARIATNASRNLALASAAESGSPSVYNTFKPILPLDGAVVAAAIVCLASVDIQATILKRQSKSISGCYVTKSGLTGPTGCGFISLLNYVSFIAPTHYKFEYIRNVPPAGSANYNFERTDALKSSQYEIATPVVKLAALEAFLGLCLVQFDVYHEKFVLQQKQQAHPHHPSTSSSATVLTQSSFSFISAMVEAVCALIANEPCRATRIGAAQALLDAVQDRPLGRSAFKALALGEPWLCIGFSDPSAITLPAYSTNLLSHNRRGKSGTYKELFRNTTGSHTVAMVAELWDLICTHSANDQAVRATLLTAWIYVFGPHTPLFMPLPTHGNREDQSVFMSILSSERVRTKDPLDCAQKLEMALRHGLKYRPPNASDKRLIAPNSEKLRVSTNAGGLNVKTNATPSAVGDGLSLASPSPNTFAAPTPLINPQNMASSERITLSSPRASVVTPGTGSGGHVLKLSWRRPKDA